MPCLLYTTMWADLNACFENTFLCGLVKIETIKALMLVWMVRTPSSLMRFNRSFFICRKGSRIFFVPQNPFVSFSSVTFSFENGHLFVRFRLLSSINYNRKTASAFSTLLFDPSYALVIGFPEGGGGCFRPIDEKLRRRTRRCVLKSIGYFFCAWNWPSIKYFYKQNSGTAYEVVRWEKKSCSKTLHEAHKYRSNIWWSKVRLCLQACSTWASIIVCSLLPVVYTYTVAVGED